MNLSDIIIRVQRQFGDTSGVQITREDITRWANDAQIEMVRKTECYQKTQSIDSVVGQTAYTLATDIIQIKRVTYQDVPILPTTIQQMDAEQMQRDVAPILTGTPTQYYIWGGSIYLSPAPSSVVVSALDIFYVAIPATLIYASAETLSVPIYMHEDIVRYCLSRAKEMDEDTQGAQQVMQGFQTRLQESAFESQMNIIDTYPAVRDYPGDWQ